MSDGLRDPADVAGPLRASLPHVLVGGTLGAAARIALLAVPGLGSGWGVLVANVAGALLLGVLFERLAEHRLRRTTTWSLWGPGFLGAFTTFSALAMVSVEAGRDGSLATGAAYLAVSVALGLAAARLGRTLGARR